jgi:thiol:disulfide interchange protein DsbC
MTKFNKAAVLSSVFTILLSGCTANPGAEAAVPAGSPDKMLLQTAIQHLMPEASISQVNPLSPHLTEVYVGDALAYMTPDGKHLLVGKVIDTQTGKDLSEASLTMANGVSWKDLPFAATLKVSTGSRELFLVEDPNCGYCRELHKTLAQIKDLTVHVLPAPILGVASQTQIERVYCSTDPVATWMQVMTRGVHPAAAICDPGVQKSAQAMLAARALNVRSTPVMFFPSGQRITGVVSKEEIEKALQQKS